MKRRTAHRCGSLAAAVALVCVVAACGGDKSSGPVPCDTYTGGILSGTSSGLPGTYVLKSFCQGMKPDVAGASGSVTITVADFTASITIQTTTTTYSGAYTTSAPDNIVVNLTSPAPVQFAGTFRLRNDSLAVSGAAAGQSLSLLGTRAP